MRPVAMIFGGFKKNSLVGSMIPTPLKRDTIHSVLKIVIEASRTTYLVDCYVQLSMTGGMKRTCYHTTS